MSALIAAIAAVTAGYWLTPAAALHVEYLSGVSSMAPFVALLGAKRPQNRAWQWIVAALLLLLALQSVKAIWIDRGGPPALHAAWQWLLAVLLVAEWINYLATRNAIAASFVFVGQICLLADYLPLVSWPHESRPALGLGLISTGVLATALSVKWGRGPRAAIAVGDRELATIDRTWLEFRDAYGALWALRVAERINAVCRQNGWPVRLGWPGFQATDCPPTSEPFAEESLERQFRALLSRFVDRAWKPDA